MIKVDVCDAAQQPYAFYPDPDTSKRHVRKASSIGAFLAISSDAPIKFFIEVDGADSEIRKIDGTGKTSIISLQELIASTTKPASTLSRIIGYASSQRSEILPVTEFRISFTDPTGANLRGTVIFKLQDEVEFDSTYGDRVRARPAGPDEPQFTTDASSIELGKACWHCHTVLPAGSTYCNVCFHDQ